MTGKYLKKQIQTSNGRCLDFFNGFGLQVWNLDIKSSIKKHRLPFLLYAGLILSLALEEILAVFPAFPLKVSCINF